MIRYPSYFSSTKTIREFLECVTLYLGISQKWRSRVVLIADELNNNAVEYGSLSGEENILIFYIEKISEQHFLCELSVQDS